MPNRLNLTRQEKIDRFNQMYDRVETKIMEEKIEKLLAFIAKEPHQPTEFNITEKGRQGIFIATHLSKTLTPQESKLFSKRKDLHDEAQQQATTRFPNDKAMIKKVTINLYGYKIYTEFLKYHWDNQDFRNRLKR